MKWFYYGKKRKKKIGLLIFPNIITVQWGYRLGKKNEWDSIESIKYKDQIDTLLISNKKKQDWKA
jgi:hypothetical protein